MTWDVTEKTASRIRPDAPDGKTARDGTRRAGMGEGGWHGACRKKGKHEERRDEMAGEKDRLTAEEREAMAEAISRELGRLVWDRPADDDEEYGELLRSSAKKLGLTLTE